MEFKPGVSKRQQVADDMRRRIQSGEWKKGKVLDGVFDLADQYGCSMEVVRQAEHLLAEEGWLNKPKQGLWTRVADAQPRMTVLEALAEAREIYEDLGRKLDVLSRVLGDVGAG